MVSVDECRVGMSGSPKNAPTSPLIGPFVISVKEAWKKASAWTRPLPKFTKASDALVVLVKEKSKRSLAETAAWPTVKENLNSPVATSFAAPEVGVCVTERGLDSMSRPGTPSRPGNTSMDVEALVEMIPPPSDARNPVSICAERAKPFHPDGGVSTTEEQLAE